jgi:hypothetical protein
VPDTAKVSVPEVDENAEFTPAIEPFENLNVVVAA